MFIPPSMIVNAPSERNVPADIRRMKMFRNAQRAEMEALLFEAAPGNVNRNNLRALHTDSAGAGSTIRRTIGDALISFGSWVRPKAA